MEFFLYGLILLMALFGMPLYLVMSAFALVAFYHSDVSSSAVLVEATRLVDTSTFMAIPLFTIAGFILAKSRSPHRLLKWCQSILGPLPGGVAIVALAICAFFTAFTGASGVAIIALGGIIYPILKEEKFSDSFSLGLVTSSGSLGLLFPPSLPLILYGLVARVDIDKLFLAGVVPGVLLIVILSLFALYKAPLKNGRGSWNFADMAKSTLEAKWELLLPVIILWGIYGGLMTPTEAASITVAYVVLIECFIYKEVSMKKDMPDLVSDSMALVGSILIILCCALGMTNYLVDEDIPSRIVELVGGFIHSKWMFLLCLNVLLLLVGALMDIFSAIIIVLPLILPLAQKFSVDPIHLAMIFLTNLEIGYLTPPVGINLFIASSRFNRPVAEMYRHSLPFLLLLLLGLMIITYVPQLSTFWFQGRP